MTTPVPQLGASRSWWKFLYPASTFAFGLLVLLQGRLISQMQDDARQHLKLISNVQDRSDEALEQGERLLKVCATWEALYRDCMAGNIHDYSKDVVTNNVKVLTNSAGMTWYVIRPTNRLSDQMKEFRQ